MPDALSGMEMIAPSGKFWMAIPAERAIAPAAVRPLLPARTPRIYHAYRHSLRNIMERHRQNEHRRLLEMAPRPFHRFRIHVQMRNNVIQKQKKRHTHTETDHRGKERPPPHRRRLLQRRKEQTEKRSSYHHTRCKSRKAALNRSVQPSPHEKRHTPHPASYQEGES